MSRMSETRQREHSHPFAGRMIIVILLGGVIASAIIASSSSALTGRQFLHASSTTPVKTIASNGADKWDNDEMVTTLTSTFSLAGSRKIGVSSLFRHYYQDHGAAQSLGEPITVAFPTESGWMQFFEAGALLLPATQQAPIRNRGTILTDRVDRGMKDPATGVVRQPLLQELLDNGSLAIIGSAESSMTYVNLRSATQPDLMLHAPVPIRHGSNPCDTLNGQAAWAE